MFKSCQYCRHRKKKCVWNDSVQHGPCVACQRLGVVCELEARQPSLKRQRTSQRVASNIKADHTNTSRYSPPEGALSTDGDCQVLLRSDSEQASKNLLLADNSSKLDGLNTIEVYRQVLRYELPFLPEEYLIDDNDPLLNLCIKFAANVSLTHGIGHLTQEDLDMLAISPQGQSPSDRGSTGLLLLLPRLRLESVTVDKVCFPLSGYAVTEREQVFDWFTRLDSKTRTLYPVATGVLTAHSWLCLYRRTHRPIAIPPTTLLDYAAALELNTFAPHFLKLTHLAATFHRLTERANDVLDADLVQSWAKLEYAALLSVVEMDTQFLDLRDDMPASVAAVVTHMLQNMIYLRLYGFLLCEMPQIGEALSLRPVPGMLYFVCAITRSTFVCQPRVLDFWPLIIDIQAQAASLMVKLWRMTRFENCRALLNLWKPTAAHEELAKEARACAGAGPWSIEHIDGFSCFWTFRDVRSLGLEVYMRS